MLNPLRNRLFKQSVNRRDRSVDRPALRSLTQGVLGLSLVMGTVATLGIVPTLVTAPAAQAFTARLDVSLDRMTNEAYTAFMRRAELVARAAAQRTFDRDILASSVVIHILGRNQGAEAPVLTLEVTRDNWRKRPDTRTWATYYRTANALLGFSSSPTDAPFVPPAANAPFPVIPASAPPVPNASPEPNAPSDPISVPPSSSDVR